MASEDKKTEMTTDEVKITKSSEPMEEDKVVVKTETAEDKKETAENKKEAAEDNKETAEVKTEAAEVKKETEEAKTESTEAETKPSEKSTEEEKNGDKKDEELSDLDRKIIKQIEYYFGDMNLGRDKFLQAHIKIDNGWVKISVLLTFNRLLALSESAEVIASAMRKSSGLVEVHEDGTKIRRNPEKPLPVFDKERRENLKSRSIYVKGFSTEMSFDELEEYFVPFGSTEQIVLRRDAERKFKGSVFAIFKSIDDAKKFLDTEDVKHKDNLLTKMYKDDYFKMKLEEKKKLKETELKDLEEKKEEAENESFADRITKGSVMQLQGLPDGLSVEDLREKFSEFGEVAWIEFKRGDTDARVRFSSEDEAKTALEKAEKAGEGKVKVNDTEVKAYVLEGEDELKFWKDLFNERKNRKSFAKKRRGRHGGGPQHKRRKY